MVPRFGPIVSPSFQSPKLVASPAPLPPPLQVVLPLEQNSTDRPPTRQIQTSNLSRLNRDLISRGSNFKLGNKVPRATEFHRYTQGVELSINFKRRSPSPPPSPGYPSISVTRRGGEGQFGGRIYDFSLTTPDGNNSPSVSTSLGLISNSAFGKIRENERTFQIWSRDFVFSIMARSRTVLNWTKFFFFFFQ